MKKTTKAKTTPATPAPVPAKKKAKAPSSKKVVSPKVSAAAAAAVAPAPAAPAPEVKKPVAQPAKPSDVKPAVIKIKAQFDVGFGNSLYIRGTGAGLNWDRGVEMNCVNAELWSITLVGVNTPVTFKFLANDTAWSLGEDYVAHPGDDLVIAPEFTGLVW